MDWRERKKARTRQRLQDEALRLFVERGYDATTVEQIAAAAGVSHMTFFRYFSTKEDVVLSDSYDPLLVAAIQSRPSTEAPVTRIHTAIREGLGAIYPMIREPLLVRTRLALRTPALRARLWDDQFATRDLLAGALADGEPTFAMRVLASACLSALTTALEEWVDTDGTADLLGLIDAAFRALEDRP